MDIIDFILHDKPLPKNKYVLKKFVIKSKWQNNGVMETDAFKFIKLYNNDVEFCYYCSGLILNNHNTCLLSMGGHTILLYKNSSGNIEKYDSADPHNRLQYTSNNCTLFAAIIGAIRPLLKDMKTTIKIMKMLSDKKNTKSSRKLAEISKHYFNRGIEYFGYKN